jgi:phospholipid/cholesterol/gamma-HCH transport system substrate-binding protein
MQRALIVPTHAPRRLISALRRIRENSVLLGATVVGVVVVVLAAAALVYVHPPGRKTIAFETTDAASLSVGEEVRVAGISVGKVSKISLQPESVRVELSIDSGTFVGANSLVDVRMLTPVGGYAVTVIPVGDRPLGAHTVIPRERVTVPYSIADVLQAAPHVTDKVNGGTVNDNIDQVADALQHNSTSIKSIIDGLNSIATVMDRQRDQVQRVMHFAAEYSQTFNQSREFIFELLRQVEIVVSRYNTTKAGFNQSYINLGDIVDRVTPFLKFYLNHSDELLAAVTKTREAVGEFQKALGPALDKLKSLQQQLQQWLGPDGLKAVAGGTVLASNICIPTPGRTC